MVDSGSWIVESQPPSRLLAAALASDESALRAAIEAGDDINQWDSLGMTPLLYAVDFGLHEIARLLEARGARTKL
jgi:ankyrin repeat protein